MESDSVALRLGRIGCISSCQRSRLKFFSLRKDKWGSKPGDISRAMCASYAIIFFFSSRRRHTRFDCDWSSDVCSSDLAGKHRVRFRVHRRGGGALVTRAGESRAARAEGRVVARFNAPQAARVEADANRSEEHTSELQSQSNLVCRLLLEKKKEHNKPTTLSHFFHTCAQPNTSVLRTARSYKLLSSASAPALQVYDKGP